MIKETLLVIQAYDFNSETLPTKNLHRMRLEIKIESWSPLLNNSASTLRQQRPRQAFNCSWTQEVEKIGNASRTDSFR
jgi:hypothetical protein